MWEDKHAPTPGQGTRGVATRADGAGQAHIYIFNSFQACESHTLMCFVIRSAGHGAAGHFTPNEDSTGASAQYESELTTSPPARVASFCQTPSWAFAVNERVSVMLKVGVYVMVTVLT
jgi:hypothetical protein